MPTDTIKNIINVYNPTLGSHPRLDDYITLTKQYVSKCTFGDSYNNAVALLTLHQLALATPQDGGTEDPNVNSSNVVGEKEGDLSKNYGGIIFSGNTTDDYLKTTDYGRQYYFLQKRTTLTVRNRFIAGCR